MHRSHTTRRKALPDTFRISALSLLLFATHVYSGFDPSQSDAQKRPNCAPPPTTSDQFQGPPVLMEKPSIPKQVKRVPPCPLRDEGEGEGEGEPDAEAGAVELSQTSRYLRHIVPLAVAMLVLLNMSTLKLLTRGRIQSVLLGVCALSAIGNYTDFGRWPDGAYRNDWEFFHYYLGSKYLPELGYTRLYEAALVADDETGRKFSHEKNAIRNLKDGQCVHVNVVLNRRDEIRSHFSPKRWDEFTRDVQYFKGQLSEFRWNGIFHDKGYNATPMWSTVVRPLTGWASTSRPGELTTLSLIDPMLLMIAVAAVWRTFGFRSAMLVVVLVGTHMAMSHTHMKGALLRTDWVVALVLGVCAAKSGRPAVSGVFVAYAAAARVFPAIFAFGPLALLLFCWVRRERPRRAVVRFGAGFLISTGALAGISFLAIGAEHWVEFIDKIRLHNDSFSPWRVGFKHLFLGAYEYRAEEAGTHQQVFHDRWLLWWALQVCVLVGFAFLIRRKRLWEVLALGFVPTFFLVAPTYYYYIMLVVPMLYFAGRIHQRACAIGVVCLLISSNVAYVIYDSVGRELELFYVLSCMILFVCALMCFSAQTKVVDRQERRDQWSSPMVARLM